MMFLTVPAQAAMARIAFVHDGDIWLMDGNGENKEQITALGDVASFPSWSPDNSTLVFGRSQHRPDENLSPEQGKQEINDIWTVATDGAALTRLTDNKNSGDPWWSPTAALIVFILGKTYIEETDEPEKPVIATIDLPGKKTSIFNLEGVSPRFTSRGENIVFTTLSKAGNVARSATKNGENSRNLWPTQDKITDFSFANDDTKVIYVGYNEKEDKDILIMRDLAAKQDIPVFKNDTGLSIDDLGNWSPGNDAFVFCCEGNVYLLKLADRSVTGLTTDGVSTKPCWSH